MINFSHNPLVYVTRDIERALGIPVNTKGYYIISNYSPFVKRVIGARKNVILIKEKKILDTRELLVHPRVVKYLNGLNKTNNKCATNSLSILVFKNTSAIEKICQNQGWKLVNPPAVLAGTVEEKISQAKWLGELAKYLPPHKIILGKELKWSGTPFVVQFNRAHTGNGTLLITSEADVKALISNFPAREIRVTDYIAGSMITNNNIVWGKRILTGTPYLQITGLPPFTTRQFATIGNDWSLARRVLSARERREYEEMVRKIGEQMRVAGWVGLFGVDAIREHKTGKIYLIEINARQPAGAVYESTLQQQERKNGSAGLTTMEAHLAAVAKINLPTGKLIRVLNGAQVVQKVPDKSDVINKIKPGVWKHNVKELKKLKVTLWPYANREAEADLWRVQTKEGVMSSPDSFNALGTKIANWCLATLANTKWNIKQ